MENIRIYCENDQSYHQVPLASDLQTIAAELAPADTLAALVDNQLKELSYQVLNTHTIRFIGYDHPDGRRTYIRSLCFVLQNVIRELYPDKILVIDYSLPSGLYCEIREKSQLQDGRPCVYNVSDEEIETILSRMQEIVAADLPFHKVKLFPQECIDRYEANGQIEKVNLVRSTGRLIYSAYILDGQTDTFYGPLVSSTGCLALAKDSVSNIRWMDVRVRFSHVRSR